MNVFVIMRRNCHNVWAPSAVVSDPGVAETLSSGNDAFSAEFVLGEKGFQHVCQEAPCRCRGRRPATNTVNRKTPGRKPNAVAGGRV